MRIGIAYNVKIDGLKRPDLPDDFQEEFDSQATIEALADTVRQLGHEVTLLGDGRELLVRVLADPPDLVLNLAEGLGISRSREARIPALLEMLDIPYTGSDPLTLAATLDKDCAKRLARSADVVVPRSLVLTCDLDLHEIVSATDLPFPAVVKPAWEGSSKGIRDRCLVEDRKHLLEVVGQLRESYHQPLLVEEYIAGDELTVGVIGNAPAQVLGIMRIIPQQPTERFIYSLEAKRNYKTRVRYESPAQLSPQDQQAVEEAALRAHGVLGCLDIARLDFRLRDGIPYFLEANPLPGLSPETGDLVLLARGYGWTHSQLIDRIIESALSRQHPAAGKQAC